MRYDRTDLPKTNITSLAATTGIVVFVAWMACFAIQHDSIFTHDLTASPPAASAAPQARVGATPSSD
jgi:hypothetical protein